MPGRSHQGPLPQLTGPQVELRAHLRAHVEKIAGEIGGRSVLEEYEALESAASYISSQLESSGYSVKSQPFESAGRTVRNIETELRGSSGEIVIIGAHYDTAGGLPGANDNASGVAATLELARLAHARRFEHTIRFVFFVNEEPPFFRGPEMGSWIYARRCRERRDRIIGMLSLETIAYYTNEPGSQMYPFGARLGYPDQGNFIAFVSNVASRDLLHRAVRTFRGAVEFPSEGVAAPDIIDGIGWSDHWSFWQFGYQAIMLTDTALFRYPHYHTSCDTPDKLDYDGMARVVSGVEAAVAGLARALDAKTPLV
jgi:Zn-dependent M28 family amino/carboxypeptidase